MISPNELRKGQDQLQFALTVLGRPKLERKGPATPHRLMVVPRVTTSPVAKAVPQDEIILSGGRLLLGLAVVISVGSLFIWEFVRHWLFAP
jgi:hypothetical protein